MRISTVIRSYCDLAGKVGFWAAVSLPICFVIWNFRSFEAVTSLIYFGREFEAISLQQVRNLGPSRTSKHGYDGQFYAQLAIDPALRDPNTGVALDNPTRRSQRILLPLLAHILGSGRAESALYSYAALNAIFYLALVGLLVWYLGLSDWRDYLVASGILLTTGTMVSMMRSLTDLPAAFLVCCAAVFHGWRSSIPLGLSLLCKETSLLSLTLKGFPPAEGREKVLRWGASLVLILFPFAIWNLYVRILFGAGSGTLENLGWPMLGWWRFVSDSWSSLLATPFRLRVFHTTPWEDRLFDVASCLSLVVQAFYFVVHWQWRSTFWRMGVGWALVMPLLSQSIFVEQYGYTRVVLPLAFAFNLLLWQERPQNRSFCLWWCAGNLGLAWGWHEMLVHLLR